MNLWLALIGGVIIGWLIEWVVDWYYWRRGVAEWYALEGALRREIQELREENATLRDRLGPDATSDSTADSTAIPKSESQTAKPADAAPSPTGSTGNGKQGRKRGTR